MAEEDHIGRKDRPAALSGFWQSPALIGDPIAQCLILIVLISAVFLAAPGIDLWFSGLFYTPGIGFPMARLGAFIGLRELHSWLTIATVIGLIAAWLIKVALPLRPSLVRPRDIVFILSTLIIGPGIIANLIFKNHWGRPRPFTVTDFGGDLPFVAAWRITDYCATNCSFVSGEGSSAIWLLTLAVLVPERWRPTAVRVLLALAVVFALNRIAFGGHFLSDVLLGWFMTLLVMAVLYRLLYVSPPPLLEDARLEEDVTRNSLRLWRGVRALKERVNRPPG